MSTQLTTTSPAAEPTPPPRGRLTRLMLGRRDDPRWARPALWAVLVLAGFLYAWDLSRNGNANSFYAAAVLSGTESWKAFFYGSVDSASFMTVDKPPFAFWVMGLSARVFGFNSWSLLLPQAAEGVAAVAVVYAAVRRSVAGLTGERGAHAAGLIAALALTLTPVVVAINRDDNPDTMLTLLLALGAWGVLESLRAGRPGKAGLARDAAPVADDTAASRATGHPLAWLMLSAVAFGLAFNTKMLEGFIPLPALAVVYLIAANGRLRARIGRLLAAGGVLAVITLSWMTIVDLIPKSSRPYVSGSTNDTVWNLAVGYNGFARITGNEGAFGRGVADAGTGHGAAAGGVLPVGDGGAAASEFARRAGGFGAFGGQSGIGRMFGATLGGQISWLIPFAAIALIATLILIGRRPRTDLARASVLVWGGWLLLEFFVLSFQQGIQHSYYTSAMAPPIAALTGIGAVALYQARRRSRGWSLVLPLAIAVTGAWSFVLLRRTPSWNPWLAWTVLGATVVAVLALAPGVLETWRSGAGRYGGQDAAGRNRRLLTVAGTATLIAVVAGPAAYAATPLSQTVQGVNPVAGPSAAGIFGGAGTGFAGRPGSGPGPTGTGPFGAYGQRGAGGAGRDRGAGGLGAFGLGAGGARFAGGAGGARFAGGAGGAASKQLIAYLEAHRDGATWLVAVRGSDAAAAIILQTGGIPVMAMGGFSGTDPAPTVAQLAQYVKEGKLHYVLTGGAGGFGGPGAGGGTAGAVTSWVEQNCTAVPASAYGGSATSAPANSAAGAVAASAAQRLYLCG